jgi:hypothetical protein
MTSSGCIMKLHFNTDLVILVVKAQLFTDAWEYLAESSATQSSIRVSWNARQRQMEHMTNRS